MHGFGPQDRLHAAEHDEDARDGHEREGREPEEIHLAENRQLDALVAQDRLDREGAGEDRDGRLGEDVADEEDQRQDSARGRRVASFEELRRREYIGAQVERREHPAEHEDQVGVQLPMRKCHAGIRAGPGEPDEVLGADVRSEDRRADQKPAGAAAREEVVGRVPLLQERAPDADRGVGDEVQGDDGPVDRRKGNGCSGHAVRPVELLRGWSRVLLAANCLSYRSGAPARAAASDILSEYWNTAGPDPPC